MEEFKGTPGPWFAVKNMAGHQTVRITQRNGQQKTLFISLDDERSDSDAHLIAAAPELLAKLQEVADELKVMIGKYNKFAYADDPADYQTVSEAYELINKALNK